MPHIHRLPSVVAHTDRKAIEIIVPVYKSAQLTARCLKSLAEHVQEIASGDPRLSVEERYKSAQDYTDKRKHAVDALVQQGFVLPEDADALAHSMPLPGTAQGKL